MVRFNFYKHTGLTPYFGLKKDRYGPWMYVFSLRLWWSLFSFSLDMRSKAKHLLSANDKTLLDVLFKKDSSETRVWMKRKS